MRIEVAIIELEALKESGETDVIISWWSRGFVSEMLDVDVDLVAFQDQAQFCDGEIDWSPINDQIGEYFGDDQFGEYIEE